jgi:integrase
MHGTISITKSVNADTGETKTTKSKAPRRIPIEPSLLPLLVAMRGEVQGKGNVVSFPIAHRHAEALREMLKLAGVTRAALFERSPSVKPIRFHDLRSTGITWMAVRGDDPLRIQQRAGHTSFKTTQLYINEAEILREGFGSPFAVLPDGLLEEQSIGSIDRHDEKSSKTCTPGRTRTGLT